MEQASPPHDSQRGSHHHKANAHGNPEDLASYIARMESPERAAWQQPDDVVKALGLRPGHIVCDVGAGPGYFALRLARAVEPRGWVFAADADLRVVEVLRERATAAGIRNLTPILALPDNAPLPYGACDVVFIANTYHHFADGPAFLARAAQALKPGGRLVNIDFHKRELPFGPPPELKVAREDFLAEARGVGLKLVAEHAFLEHQYFVELKA